MRSDTFKIHVLGREPFTVHKDVVDENESGIYLTRSSHPFDPESDNHMESKMRLDKFVKLIWLPQRKITSEYAVSAITCDFTGTVYMYRADQIASVEY